MFKIFPQGFVSRIVPKVFKAAGKLSGAGALNQLEKDVFVSKASLTLGKKIFKFPNQRIEQLGNEYIAKAVQKTENMEKDLLLNEYAYSIRETVSKSKKEFLTPNKLQKFVQKITKKEHIKKNEAESLNKIITDCSHEATGSYLSGPKFKIAFPDESLTKEEQVLIANNAFKEAVSHVNETFRRYQFFLDNKMHRADATIGADKFFNLVKDAFAKQAEDKSINLVFHGEDLIKRYFQSTSNDYRNYIITSNLVGNAIKYSPKGSTVEMGFKMIESNKKLHFFIKDQGIGILKEDQSKVLNQIRGSNVGDIQGSGYGLYRTSSLVQDCGGEIKITSPLYPDELNNKGTMFECPIYSDITQTFPKII